MGGASALDLAYREHQRPRAAADDPRLHAQCARRPRGDAPGHRGPVLTYSVACASSSLAIAEAAKAVQRGEVDVAIAGGSEALIVPGVVLAWQAMQTLATLRTRRSSGRAVRPFAADRNGFALGEGAAFLVLESAERARRRERARLRRPGRLGPELRRHPPDQARRARPGARDPRRAAQAGLRPPTWATAMRMARPPDRRCRRTQCARGGLGRRPRPAARQFHQGPARPPAGRRRRPRSGDHRAGASTAAAAAECALPGDGPGLRAEPGDRMRCFGARAGSGHQQFLRVRRDQLGAAVHAGLEARRRCLRGSGSPP